MKGHGQLMPISCGSRDDFSRDELLDMLDKGAMSKKKLYARDESFKPFAGQTMAMIFTKPSARTRVSFETVGETALQCRCGADVEKRSRATL